MRLAAFALVLAGLAHGQGVDYVRANYTKHEFEIPARDGVKLFTAVYVPKDTSRTYPIRHQRSASRGKPRSRNRSAS